MLGRHPASVMSSSGDHGVLVPAVRSHRGPCRVEGDGDGRPDAP